MFADLFDLFCNFKGSPLVVFATIQDVQEGFFIGIALNIKRNVESKNNLIKLKQSGEGGSVLMLCFRVQ